MTSKSNSHQVDPRTVVTMDREIGECNHARRGHLRRQQSASRPPLPHDRRPTGEVKVRLEPVK